MSFIKSWDYKDKLFSIYEYTSMYMLYVYVYKLIQLPSKIFEPVYWTVFNIKSQFAASFRGIIYLWFSILIGMTSDLDLGFSVIVRGEYFSLGK